MGMTEGGPGMKRMTITTILVLASIICVLPATPARALDVQPLIELGGGKEKPAAPERKSTSDQKSPPRQTTAVSAGAAKVFKGRGKFVTQSFAVPKGKLRIRIRNISDEINAFFSVHARFDSNGDAVYCGDGDQWCQMIHGAAADYFKILNFDITKELWVKRDALLKLEIDANGKWEIDVVPEGAPGGEPGLVSDAKTGQDGDLKTGRTEPKPENKPVKTIESLLSDGTKVTKTVHPDGSFKKVTKYPDGKEMITEKKVYQDGNYSMNTKLPDGTLIERDYADPGGEDSSGAKIPPLLSKRTVKYPSGRKETMEWAAGRYQGATVITEDGSVLEEDENGRVFQKRDKDGKIVQNYDYEAKTLVTKLSDGTIERKKDSGETYTKYTDGREERYLPGYSKSVLYPDNRWECLYLKSGYKVVRDKEGVNTVFNKEGKVVVKTKSWHEAGYYIPD